MRILRRKFTFLAVFILVLSLVAGAYFILPPSYRGSASVMVSPPDAVAVAQQQAPGQQQNVGDPADLESQMVALGSAQLMRDVLDRPGVRAALTEECERRRPSPLVARIKTTLLGPALSCATQMADTDAIVGTLQDRYKITNTGRSRVIEVAFSSVDPKLAQLMTNTLVQAYLDRLTNEKLRPRDAAIAWLQSEINRIGDKLHVSESAIEAFLSSHNLVRGQIAPIASETLTGLSQQLAVAQSEMAGVAGRRAQIRNGGGDTRDVLDSRTVSDLKAQLATTNGQVAQLAARYGTAYPGLAALQQQRDQLQSTLAAETGRVVSSIDNDYQAAAARVAQLQQQVDALKKQVGAGDNAMTQIAALQRDIDVDRELYLDLSKRLNELQSERRLVVGDAKLVSFAELPDKVFFPKISTFGLTGLLLAVALAGAAALLRDRSDNTVRSPGNIQAAAGVRVLAHIPRVRRMAGGVRLVRQLEQPSALQEAIRGLYAECMLVDKAVPLRSMMVTSSLSGEGKSFVTLALAHFAAAAGQRVLVLECDLRQPSLGRTLGLTPLRGGVSSFLRGNGGVEDIATPTGMPLLDIALCGRPAVNSTELLSSRRMRQLLEWATESYDLVLIDTPPNQLLRDARVLARHVDGVLYCAQWGQSQTNAVLSGVQSIQAAGGHVVGLILDRVEDDQYSLYDASAAQGAYPALQAS